MKANTVMCASTGGTSQAASLALAGDKDMLDTIKDERTDGPRMSTSTPRITNRQPIIPVAVQQFLV